MAQPSTWMVVRQTLGRAFRETGQALDRLGIMGQQHAVTTRVVGDDPYRFHDNLSRHRHQMPLLNHGAPIVSPDVAFLAPCSTLIGSVRVGKGASIWYGAILRADKCENGTSFNNPNDDSVWELHPDRVEMTRFSNRDTGGGIFIGEDSNVQDGCIITSNISHAEIGKGVTIGHLAQIHSATVEDHCLIGMGSVLREGVVVETESFIAAGAVVMPGTRVPSGELWVGHPARKLRDLSAVEREKLHYQADEVRS
jgi:carbonic anhydrase/acetyltransferase-like protein (isoleucine patch superfamily)